jgi:TonB family protein
MFDTTSVSVSRRDRARRLAALPAAVAIHALALGVVAVGQLWAVDPVHEVVPVPPLVVHLPPPSGSDHTASRRMTGGSASRQGHREATVPPVTVPAEAAKTPDSEPSSDADRVPGTEGLGGLEPGGSGLRDAPELPAVEPDVEAEPPRQVGGDVRAPVAVTRTAPAYPEVARRLRIQGVVLLAAVIDSSGDVVDVRVLNDIGFGCAQAAVAAVRTWKYRPGTLHGRPVSVWLEVKVSFRLDGAG